MNKFVFVSVCLMIHFAVLAATDIITLGEPKISQAMEKAIQKKQGGFLKKPGSFEGKIVVIDGRKKANTKEVADAVEKLVNQQGFRVEISAREITVISAKQVIELMGAKVGVVIVEDDVTPSLLVYPDDGYAIINAKKVVKGSEQSRLMPIRIKKQILRAIGYVCGGMSSQYDGTLCAPVRDPSDLDSMPQELPMDVVFSFRKYLAPYGITPYSRVTYRRACQEGWAPQPTNSFQKAVWDEVHSLPTKPITIKYDKKKGE